MSIIQEFKAFVARGNVVDLAVGIIMGTAFTGVVNSLVADVIMPPIGMVTGGMDFSNYFLSLSGGDYISLSAAKEAGAATINYGVFLNTIINFFIVSAAVFLLIKQINRIHRTEQAAAETSPSSPSKSEELLGEIRDLLKKQQRK